ncbi:MAG: helix-turn-helix transcriptional regulator [Candidatus Methanofastidiosa archaeon]|nr:helix-turn-helix transcriptional regulator [Candidatus Methanofastidiosa archaeon]
MRKVFFEPEIMGKKLKELMNKKNVLREDLADMLGISPDTVYRYEKGKIPIKHDYIVELCQTFKVKTDYFYYRDDVEIANLEEKEAREEIEQMLSLCSDFDMKRICSMMKLMLARPVT